MFLAQISKFTNQPWGRATLFGIVYLGLTVLASLISFPSANFPTLWLPGGLLLGVLYLSPLRQWPLYMLVSLLGSAAHSVLFSHPPIFGLMVYLSNCLEATTGAWLLLRLNGLVSDQNLEIHPSNTSAIPRFDTPRDVLQLVVAAFLSASISALVQTAILISFHNGFSYWSGFRIAWIGHSLGTLIMAPLILAWSGVRLKRSYLIYPERLIELCVLIIGLIAWSIYIFTGSAIFLGRAYLVMPFLVWAALRFGPIATTASGLIIATTATWGLVNQLSGFAVTIETITPNMDTLGIFLGIILITGYILATSWEEGRRAASELSRSEGRYRRLIENQGEGIGIVNLEEKFTFSNPAGNQIFGVYPDSLVGRNLKDFSSEDQFRLITQQTELRKQNTKSSYEIEIIQPGGQRRLLLVTATPEFDEQGNINGSFAIFRDITDRKQSELAVQDSQARYQALFDHSPIPIWEEDFSGIKQYIDALRAKGIEDFRQYFDHHPYDLQVCERAIRVLNVNQAAVQLFNYDDKNTFMEQINTMLRRGPDDVLREEVIAISEGRTEFDCEGPNDLIDGTIRHHHVRWSVAPGYEDDYSRVIVSIIDITERKRTEEKLRYLSTHDLLTGLYNRNFFETEMERLQQGRQYPINIMVVDVNGMKDINDSYGHTVGDELLKRTAQVLKMAFRKEDIIARIGGDEFVVLFTGPIAGDDAIQRVNECLIDHNRWVDGPPLSLSIGVSTGSKGMILHEVLKKADQLMYREKVRFRKDKGN